MTNRWWDSVSVGASAIHRRTVSESDVYLFAGVTGDMSPNHLDEDYMSRGQFGTRIVHGALLVGLMSGAATKFFDATAPGIASVSLGYDKIRFVAPVFLGDTVVVEYRIEELDTERNRSMATATATNQRGDLVAVATHITKYVTS